MISMNFWGFFIFTWPIFFTATESNWEFYSMNPMRTSTPSSGYNSNSSVSRTSSFSSKRLTSADDSAYSEVYSTIEELSELADPFDEPKPEISHQKTASSTSTILASNHSNTLRKCSTCPPNPAPPLPPRLAQCRPPARPPYPSSHVKQNSHWKLFNCDHENHENFYDPPKINYCFVMTKILICTDLNFLCVYCKSDLRVFFQRQ